MWGDIQISSPNTVIAIKIIPLTVCFKNYSILKPGFSRALGDTRRPANDVTLWAQSHGVASLYKPVLATLAMGLDPCPKKGGEYDYNNVRRRLFGVSWNGLGFVQRGRKPADILRRQDMLREIMRQIQNLVEVEYPLGNLFYRDLNGAFFTFPGIDEVETGQPLDQATSPTLINENSFATEHYLPYIMLGFSPVFCQVLFPADRTPDVLEHLLQLFNERFGKVQGKLPLHAGLLAAKRKFPLYALLEAGQQVLNDASFQEGNLQAPCWDTTN